MRTYIWLQQPTKYKRLFRKRISLRMQIRPKQSFTYQCIGTGTVVMAATQIHVEIYSVISHSGFACTHSCVCVCAGWCENNNARNMVTFTFFLHCNPPSPLTHLESVSPPLSLSTFADPVPSSATNAANEKMRMTMYYGRCLVQSVHSPYAYLHYRLRCLI